MKLKLLKYTSLLSIPVLIVPTTLSSCSVFTDLTKDYVPSYEQASGTITTTQAISKWVDKAANTNNFIKDEMFWSNSVGTKGEFIRPVVEGYDYYYKGQFTVCSSNVAYERVNNKDKHIISYKITSELEERDEYYLGKEYYGYGTNHYSIEWEVRNLEFDVTRYYDDVLTREFWLVKPVKYDSIQNIWTKELEGDEIVSFNARCIYEIYDEDGIQKYGYEATEAAVMNKELSHTTKLAKILNNFCCFYSYYLDNCKPA